MTADKSTYLGFLNFFYLMEEMYSTMCLWSKTTVMSFYWKL